MTKNRVREALLGQVKQNGGVFIIHIYLTTEFIYSESFLRKWARENSVGKLGNMYYFKEADIERLSVATNNFSKITKDINILKEENKRQRYETLKNKKSEELMDNTTKEYKKSIPLLQNNSESSNNKQGESVLNFTIKDIEDKEFLSNLDVALLTGYTIQTIEKWAKYFNVQNDGVGNYSWTKSDLRKFKCLKFWHKDSYHRHLDNIRAWNYWHASTDGLSRFSILSIIIIMTLMISCCSIFLFL